MPLHRRTVLASLGTAFLSAGCLAAADDQDGDPRDDIRTGTPTKTPEDTYSEAPTPKDRFADEPCPSFAETDRTVCARSRGDSKLYLESSSQVFRPDAGADIIETVTFALYNDSDQPFRLNPHAWQVHDRQNGQWSLVAPDAHIEPLSEVPAGKSYEWVLSQQPHPTGNSNQRSYVTTNLAPGRHAFTIDGWFDTAGDGDEKETVECLALFDVIDVVDG